MAWIEGSILLFGGLVAAMGLGLPVAFAFLVLNVVGAIVFLGGEAGLVQLARNAVQSITSFSLGVQNKDSKPAEALVKFPTTPEAAAVIKVKGLEPR